MKVTQCLFGIAVGALASASAVLLSTPKSGREVRSSLKSTLTDYQEQFSDVKIQLQDLKNTLGNLTKESKEVIPETMEAMKESITEWQNETAPIQHQLQAEIISIQLAMEKLEHSLPKLN